MTMGQNRLIGPRVGFLRFTRPAGFFLASSGSIPAATAARVADNRLRLYWICRVRAAIARSSRSSAASAAGSPVPRRSSSSRFLSSSSANVANTISPVLRRNSHGDGQLNPDNDTASVIVVVVVIMRMAMVMPMIVTVTGIMCGGKMILMR